MANVSKYETVMPNPTTGKVNPLHTKWADGRKLAIDGVRCTAEGAKVKVANGDLTDAEARAALAHVVAKVLSEAGVKVALEAAGQKGEDGKFLLADLREALKVSKEEGTLKGAKSKPKPKAVTVDAPAEAEAQAPAM